MTMSDRMPEYLRKALDKEFDRGSVGKNWSIKNPWVFFGLLSTGNKGSQHSDFGEDRPPHHCGYFSIHYAKQTSILNAANAHRVMFEKPTSRDDWRLMAEYAKKARMNPVILKPNEKERAAFMRLAFSITPSLHPDVNPGIFNEPYFQENGETRERHAKVKENEVYSPETLYALFEGSGLLNDTKFLHRWPVFNNRDHFIKILDGLHVVIGNFEIQEEVGHVGIPLFHTENDEEKHLRRADTLASNVVGKLFLASVFQTILGRIITVPPTLGFPRFYSNYAGMMEMFGAAAIQWGADKPNFDPKVLSEELFLSQFMRYYLKALNSMAGGMKGYKAFQAFSLSREDYNLIKKYPEIVQNSVKKLQMLGLDTDRHPLIERAQELSVSLANNEHIQPLFKFVDDAIQRVVVEKGGSIDDVLSPHNAVSVVLVNPDLEPWLCCEPGKSFFLGSGRSR
ncbi:MAG: hypothetical protein K2Q12_06240 [Rickettsiales bacterium]|nr:hypothetical protein [Rickettsiales bacterium]